MNFLDALLGKKSSPLSSESRVDRELKRERGIYSDTTYSPTCPLAFSTSKKQTVGSSVPSHLRTEIVTTNGVCATPLSLETELEKLRSFFLKSGMHATIEKEQEIVRELEEAKNMREQTYLALKDVLERSEKMAKEEATIYAGEERCQYDTSTLTKHCGDVLKFAAFVESGRPLSELSEVIDVYHWDVYY